MLKWWVVISRGVDSRGMVDESPLDLRWGDGVYNHPPPPGFSDEKISGNRDWERDKHISSCKASYFKIGWSNNFYIKYVLRFSGKNRRHITLFSYVWRSRSELYTKYI